MEQIEVSNLTFSYDRDSTFSLKNVSFSVNRGEFLLMIGESGCGKTTLLKHLKMDYMAQGNRSIDSTIKINGRRIEEMTQRERAGLVGFVGQNVENAQVTDKVWHELAFGLESLGYPQGVMQRKVAEMTSFFGLESIYHEKLHTLSGGQKQLVNLASVMAMEPEVLILDEPTSQLDPVAATEFFRMIEKINREIGTTILMSEHRLEEVFPLCDRVLVMEQGTMAEAGTPEQAAYYLYEEKGSLYGALPTAVKLYFELAGEAQGKIPLTVNEGRAWLEEFYRGTGEEFTPFPKMMEEKKKISGKRKQNDKVAFYADELWFRYDKEGNDILKACSLRPEAGKITAILGGNGSGKSTLLHVLAGHVQPYRGKVGDLSDCMGMLPQNPQAMFVKKTVQEELEDSAGNMKKGIEQGNGSFLNGTAAEKGKPEQGGFGIQEMIAFFELRTVLMQHPFDLSGGQMQKLALAKLLLEDYDILLLDEPGKGMDYTFKKEMGELLADLTHMGKTIVMVSHDVEFCAQYADVCGLFFDGHIVSLSDTREFFRQNVFYTTAVVRMCRNLLPQAVVMEDVRRAFGVSEYKPEVPKGCEEIESGTATEEKAYQELDKHTEKRAGQKVLEAPRKYYISILIFFVVMPFTIYIGHAMLDQRKYYFISLLLVLEAILSFFLSFEKRRLKLREVMVIAVLSAITVAGRAAFYMVPSAKPMAALTIISGVGLGGEAGFLVGAMSMLVSNIFFGQGPWTPWQMVALGMLGFLAGTLFRRDTPCNRKKKYGICLFGLFSVIIVYGGIMNPASVLIYQEHVNWEMILAAYGMGFPFDAIHGFFTFVFLWIGARPMLEKIERIRKKYGFEYS